MADKAIIVNELLAFIQNAIDTMDEISIMQICKSNFKEEDVCSGKLLLFQTLGKEARMPSRRRDGGERSIQDIITLLKETDPDDVPDFVAKELHKLPPVGFDHIDVTRLLKDITFLKTSLAEVLAKLETSDNTISELRAELLLLRNTDLVTRSPVASNNVNDRRGAQNASVCSYESAHSATASFASPAVEARAVASATPCPAAPPRISPPAETPIRVTLPTPRPRAYAAAAACPPAASQTKGKKQYCGPVRSAAPVSAPLKEPCDAEGFTEVVRKKRKPFSRNQCGTALYEASSSCFRAEVPTTQLYVSRVHFNVKTEKVVEYLKMKSGLTMRVEKLDSRHNVSFSSFMVRVPTDRLGTFMNEEFWPKGVKFRRFTGRLQRDSVHRRHIDTPQL